MRQTAACESMELTPPCRFENYAVEIIASLNIQELGKPRKALQKTSIHSL